MQLLVQVLKVGLGRGELLLKIRLFLLKL